MMLFKRISLFTAFLLFCWIFLIKVVHNEKWWLYKATIRTDVAGYYMYLQAAFIKNDLKLNYFKEELMANPSQYRPERTTDNKRFVKYTCGMAYFYLPIFSGTYLFTTYNKKYERDGFSLPFQRNLQYVGVLYLLPGLLALGKVLRRFTTGIAAGISIFIMLFATNLYYYLTGEAAFPHSINFTLCAILVYFSYAYSDNGKSKYLFGIAFVLSLLTLIRPINGLLILVPVFVNTSSLKNIGERIKTYFKFKNLIGCIAIAFLVFLPQFLYWKYATGHWIFYSYEDEGFNFADPHLLDGLFSVRKGLFFYSPVLLLIIPGIIFAWKNQNRDIKFITLFFLVYAYITFCWWNWTYGGSFGCRPLIDIYPLLAIPLAIFTEKIIRTKIFIKAIICLFIVCCLALNLFQSKQYNNNVMHWANMDWHSYKAIFGKEVLTPEERAVLEKYWLTNYSNEPIKKPAY